MLTPPAVELVLVIESDSDCSDWLAALIRAWGYEVRVAANGEAACASALKWPPAVIVIEPRLRRADGWEVIRRIRAEATIVPRCVAVTGLSRESDYLRSREVGIDVHLLKPTDPAVLLNALRL